MDTATPITARQSETLSVGDWMITILLAAIPLVNIVMLFVWAFGSNTNPNKANWAKATLIWMVIGILLWVLVLGTFITGLLSNMN